jgi:hypothetical protein
MTIESFVESLKSSSPDGKLIKPNFGMDDYLIDTEGWAHPSFWQDPALAPSCD